MPGNPITDPNWAPDLADTVERVVSKVRTTATDNAVKASRGVVFGVVILMAAMVAIPLVVILLLGVLREALATFVDHDQAVYLSYFILGGILLIGAFFALRARHKGEAA